jgi:hypothetical protein
MIVLRERISYLYDMKLSLHIILVEDAVGV